MSQNLRAWAADAFETLAQCRWPDATQSERVQVRSVREEPMSYHPQIGHQIRITAADGRWCGIYEYRESNPRFVLAGMLSGELPPGDVLMTLPARNHVIEHFEIAAKRVTDEGVYEMTAGVPHNEPGEAQSC